MKKARVNIQRIINFFVVFSLLALTVQPTINALADTSIPSVVKDGGDEYAHETNPDTGWVNFIHLDETVQSQELKRPANTQLNSAQREEGVSSYLEKYAPEFGLDDPLRNLIARDAPSQVDKREVYKYQQTYNDIPVMGGELIVNMSLSGRLLSMNGEVAPDLSIDTIPSISAEQAVTTAKGIIAKYYQEEISVLTATDPELWIFDESLLMPSERPAELVWRMEVSAQGEALNELVLINARTGGVSLHFNQVDTVWESGVLNQDDTPTDSPTEIPTEIPPTEVPTEVTPTKVTVIETPLPTETPVNPREELPSLQSDGPFALGGTDRYVATTGIDTGNCTNSFNPCATMNYAIGQAVDGDTIKVAEGSYTGSGTEVVNIGKSIELLGGWDAAFSSQSSISVIDGGNARNGIYISHNSHIAGWRIRNAFLGIYHSGGTLSIDQTSLVYNKSGLYNASGDTTIENTLFSGNYGGQVAGTAISHVQGDIVVSYSTITNNDGNYYAIYSYGQIVDSHITLDNSILWGNTYKNGNSTVDGDCYVHPAGKLVSNGNNIFRKSTVCVNFEASSFSPQVTDKVGIDPQLVGPLSNGRFALSPTSPAIDAANISCLSTADQRGVSRPQGGSCDIGAYEYSVPGPAYLFGILSGNNQRVIPGTSPSQPFVIYVEDNTGALVAGTTVTFTAPASGASGVFEGTNHIASVTSNANGIATSPLFTTNQESGAYQVVATASGLADSLIFSVTQPIWYVSTIGSNSNACDAVSSPCLSIYGVISKPNFVAGDLIKVASGTYGVVTISKPATLSGGWDSTFAFQNSYSILDGQQTNVVVTINAQTTMDHFIIQNGSNKDSRGGGIYNSAPLTLNNSLVVNNTAYNGGGIYSSRNLTLNNSVVRNNSARTGGGIELDGIGSLTLNNSTVSDNKALSAGGIYLGYISSPGSPVTLNNSTIAYNQANYGGGFYNGSHSPRSVSIKNSILASNTAVVAHPNCYGPVTASDHNIIGDTSSCLIAAGQGDYFNIDPKMSPEVSGVLGYHVLISGSPAIDAGLNCLPYDQRGLLRSSQGIACDMGAYEYSTPDMAVSFGVRTGSDQGTSLGMNFKTPLSVYVVDNQGTPVPGVVVTFTAPLSGPSGTFGNTSNSISVNTDASGIATTGAFMANFDTGAYEVVATVSGLPGSAIFDLRQLELFVVSNGSDSNDCLSVNSPCLTINGAYAKARPDDTIKVAAGIYNGTGEVVVNIAKSIILSGGWNTTFSQQNGFSIIDGQTVRQGIWVDSDAVVSNFIIQNSSTAINHRDGKLDLTNVSIINNNIGIYNNGGVANFVNATFGGNYGTSVIESAIYNNKGVVKVQSSTIVYNGGGYAINSYSGSVVEFENSILATNGRASDCYMMTFWRSNGHNIFGHSPVCSNGGLIPTPTDLVGVDPQLTPLLPGGYFAPLSTSPARDAANQASCPSTDQRGTPRLQDSSCDIGAYETPENYGLLSAIFIYDGDNQTAWINHSFQKPLMVGLIDEYGSFISTGGYNVTFNSPLAGSSLMFKGSASQNERTIVTGQNGIASSGLIVANADTDPYLVSALANGTDPVNFHLQNIAATPSIFTYSALNQISESDLVPICDYSMPLCTNGVDTQADSAQKYTVGAYNFYLNQHNRVSIDDNNLPVSVIVHYGNGYGNVYWSGEYLVFGDKYNFARADDIVAHELTHGVTQYESNLFYWYQSGAINESFSDLWGEAYDQMNGFGNDSSAVKWLIGEDIGGLAATRNMKTPITYQDPDKMTSSYYVKNYMDNGGVHSNSGVNNKAVFLMVDGGAFNGKTISGLGWNKVLTIYYEAQTNLLTSGSDYLDLYNALNQACAIKLGINGITSIDCEQVTKALQAVEMNKEPAAGFNPSLPNACAEYTTYASNIYTEDFENGTDDWKLPPSKWLLSDSYAVSGLRSVWADDASFKKAAYSLQRINPIAVPAGVNTYLQFKHAYGLEFGTYAGVPSNFDGGVVEYSINGVNWVDASKLFNAGKNYNGTIATYPGSGNPLMGKMAFVNDSHGYVDTRYDLTSLAGKNVHFRWRMGTDYIGYYNGWFIDDVNITTCLPIGKPTLLSPKNKSILKNNSLLLDWMDTPNTTGYTIQISNSSIFAGTPFIKTNVVDSSYVLTKTLPANTTFYWRVSGFNGSEPGNWSSAFSFTTANLPKTPNLITPANLAVITDTTPLFDWSNSTIPAGTSYKSYQLQVSTDLTFSSMAINTTVLGTVTNSKYVPATGLLPGLIYYWRVRTYNTLGQYSNWSKVFSFNLLPAAPLLLSPSQAQVLSSSPVTLDWSDIAGATSYTIEISSVEDFSSSLESNSTVVSEYVTSNVLPTDGTPIYWRVRSDCSAGSSSWITGNFSVSP